MQNRTRGVVLVATQDSWLSRSLAALLEKDDFQVVTSYSSASAEYALRHHDVEMAVVDAEIVAGHPQARHRAILAAYPKLRLVITNAALLDAPVREFVAAYQARLLDRAGTTELVQTVEDLFSQPARTTVGEALLKRQKGVLKSLRRAVAGERP